MRPPSRRFAARGNEAPGKTVREPGEDEVAASATAGNGMGANAKSPAVSKPALLPKNVI